MTKNAQNTGKSVSLGSTLAKWPLRTVVAILVAGVLLYENKDLVGSPLKRLWGRNKRRP
jgi:hypothetical protein